MTAKEIDAMADKIGADAKQWTRDEVGILISLMAVEFGMGADVAEDFRKALMTKSCGVLNQSQLRQRLEKAGLIPKADKKVQVENMMAKYLKQ